MKKFLITLAVVFSAAVWAADIHLAGDSTCTSYAAHYAPQAGWGQVLSDFCKSDVKILNRAVGGRSTKSFITEGRWAKLLDAVKPGDFVFIQFGHNDEKKTDKKRYADPFNAYPANLRRMISDVRAKKASVVLVTSIARCSFNKQGKIRDTGLHVYRDAVLKVAASENVPVVDMNRITEEKFNIIGESEALKYFMYSSDKPKQKGRDRTHTNMEGAKLIAGWFVDECRKQNLPVVKCFK